MTHNTLFNNSPHSTHIINNSPHSIYSELTLNSLKSNNRPHSIYIKLTQQKQAPQAANHDPQHAIQQQTSQHSFSIHIKLTQTHSAKATTDDTAFILNSLNKSKLHKLQIMTHNTLFNNRPHSIYIINNSPRSTHSAFTLNSLNKSKLHKLQIMTHNTLFNNRPHSIYSELTLNSLKSNNRPHSTHIKLTQQKQAPQAANHDPQHAIQQQPSQHSYYQQQPSQHLFSIHIKLTQTHSAKATTDLTALILNSLNKSKLHKLQIMTHNTLFNNRRHSTHIINNSPRSIYSELTLNSLKSNNRPHSTHIINNRPHSTHIKLTQQKQAPQAANHDPQHAIQQ